MVATRKFSVDLVRNSTFSSRCFNYSCISSLFSSLLIYNKTRVGIFSKKHELGFCRETWIGIVFSSHCINVYVIWDFWIYFLCEFHFYFLWDLAYTFFFYKKSIWQFELFFKPHQFILENIVVYISAYNTYVC